MSSQQVAFQWTIVCFAEKDVDILLDIVLVRMSLSNQIAHQMIQELEHWWEVFGKDEKVKIKKIIIAVRCLI